MRSWRCPKAVGNLEAEGIELKHMLKIHCRKGNQMISRISLLKGKEGVSEEDFRNALVKGFEAIAGEMPALVKCEVNVVTDRQQRSWAGRGSVDIDGFVEM